MSALDSLDVLEYRVSQLERMLEPLMKLVSDLDKKIALLAQKMVIATVLIGGVVNGAGIWYSANAQNFSESDKKQYYETRVSESDNIRELQAEIDRLKKGGK